jgi:hypothetical protein
VAVSLALAAPAHAAPPSHPDGRVQILPLVGYVHFDRGIALEGAFLYGLEFHHHFRFDNPWIALGLYAEVSGAQTRFVDNDVPGADVILANAGMTVGVRAHPMVIPTIRAGSGFALFDATKSDLEVRGRIQYHLGAGVHVFPLPWLAVRAESRLMTHDNLSLGAGSGIRRNVNHALVQVGVGVAL